MAKTDPVLARLKDIVFALPNTKLTMTWGSPHFRVGEKIFCGYGQEGGRGVLGFKMSMADAARLTREPGYWPSPYVGHKGWVSMDVSKVRDWELVRSYIEGSFRLIAPKKLVAELAGAPLVAKAARATKKKVASKKATARKATKKATRRAGRSSGALPPRPSK
jgi:predicted DNA-binding protein (MmcQ/YjbR family)